MNDYKKLFLFLFLALYFLFYLNNVSASCLDLLIKEDIQDVKYYKSEILPDSLSAQEVCEAGYDSPDLSKEIWVRVVDFVTKDQARAITLSNLRSENKTFLEVENKKIALFSDKKYFTWNYDKYIIYFYFDSDFKAPECNGFSCVLKEYITKLPSEMDKLFLEDNCYRWENLEFLEEKQNVCVEFKKKSPYVDLERRYFCEDDSDCPGGGKWIFGNSGKYYQFQCERSVCSLESSLSDKCFLDSDCLTGKCFKDSLPRKCINVESNETENLSTINLSEGSKQLENSLEKKSSGQMEKILIGVFLFLAGVFIVLNKLKNEKKIKSKK